MGGVWIIEDAEMVVLNKASSGASKQFVTERVDRIRPPYGRHPIAKPRSCVFAASINPTVGGYLKDPTGARRYWPITCHGMIDVDGLEKVRDQLWAEAVHLYLAGHRWHLETPELEALATTEQDARRVVDAWEEPIRKWIRNRLDIGSLEGVIEGALQIDHKYQTQPIQKRVVAILTRMGFTKRRPRTSTGERELRYQRDPPPTQEEVAQPRVTTGDQQEEDNTRADPDEAAFDELMLQTSNDPKKPSWKAAYKAAYREARRRANNTDSTADVRRAIRRAVAAGEKFDGS